MIARFGSIELHALVNYLSIVSKDTMFKKISNYIVGKGGPFWWEPWIMKEMTKSAGFFPSSRKGLEKFAQLMFECIPQVDVLASWRAEEIFFEEELLQAKKIRLPDLEPYYYQNPWSKVLEGKNVLVVHPFVSTIERQYKNREKLFINPDVLPQFNLLTVKAYSRFIDEDLYRDWFEALDDMKNNILKKQFDIAILGCGAYGFPLASFIKEHGKKAVLLGGATQILFGIKGRRWDTHPVISRLYNDYWVRPSPEETPIKAKMMGVENGCYW